MNVEEQAQRVLELLRGGPMSSERLRTELGATESSVRRWLRHLKDSGHVEVDGASNKAVWRICTGGMPDDSECQPFTHLWRGVGEWVHKQPARAVVSVFDLGAK